MAKIFTSAEGRMHEECSAPLYTDSAPFPLSGPGCTTGFLLSLIAATICSRITLLLRNNRVFSFDLIAPLFVPPEICETDRSTDMKNILACAVLAFGGASILPNNT